MIALSIIASAVVIAVCGLGSYLVVKDDSKVVGAPTPSPTALRRDISNRATDAVPLTINDVFPSAEMAAAEAGVPPYKRVGAVQLTKDCRLAATGEVGKLLKSLGCNQVIRATFLSPDGAYVVTAGVFNLRDNAAALKAHSDIPELVAAGKGRLAGYISGVDARALGRAPAQVNGDPQGHFLIYTVIARKDGKAFADADPNVRVIVYDVAEKYLRDRVIGEWSIDRSTPGPSSPGATTTPGAPPRS
jgi:hypothetical protein